jgi:Ca-activated chloride channel family protein
VLFMTDGLPTAGETRELAIADNCRKANKLHARLFVFGVGFDVNARLLDRLSGGNAGTSEYVRPDQDIEASVARFYSKLTSPALTAIQIELANTDVNRTYPRDIPDLFDGGQLVWVGRYRQGGRTTVRLSGKVGSERRTFDFPTELAGSDRGTSYEFVEKIWVMRRIGFIIDQIDLHGQNKELTDELVALSTKHGILTPYTSFLADERVPLHLRAENSRRALEGLQRLNELGGESGQRQRGGKQDLLAADKSSGGFIYSGAGGGSGAGQMKKSSASAPAARVGIPALAAGLSEREQQQVVNVRQVGTKTFFRKENRWVDADVKPDDEAKAKTIEQFSDKFFELARSQSAAKNQYLTFDEAITVNLDGTVYRIEKAKN